MATAPPAQQPKPPAPKPAPPKAQAPAPVPAAMPKPAAPPAKATAPPQPAKPPDAAPAPVRAKAALPTSAPGDTAERDADALANRVMRMPAGAPPEKVPQQVPQQAPPPVARAAQETPGTQPATPMLAAEHLDRLGSGEPLPPDTRALFEQRFGQSLAQVRVLDDSAAAAAAASIDARAFTLGNRIGFAAGEYQPSTPTGQWLLAHEIAHVLQQGSFSAVPRMVMRNGGGSGGGGGGAAPAGGGGGGPAAPEFRVTEELRIPPIKARHGLLYQGRAQANTLRRRAGALLNRHTAQRPVWLREVRPDLARIPADRRPTAASGYRLTLVVGAGSRVVSAPSEAEFLEMIQIPSWNRAGVDTTYQVDHIVEYQLGGNDDVGNLELLDQAHNGSVGSSFRSEIRDAVQREIDAAADGDARFAGLPGAPGRKPSAMDVLTAREVMFRRAGGAGGERPRTEASSTYWSRDDIVQLRHVLPMLEASATERRGTPTQFSILSPTGGLSIAKIAHGANARSFAVPPAQANAMLGMRMQRVRLNASYNTVAPEGAVGTLEATLDFGPRIVVPPEAAALRLDLLKTGDSGAAGAAAAGTPPAAAAAAIDYAGKVVLPATLPPLVELTGASPVELRDYQLTRGLQARATLRPTHPLLAELRLPGTVENGRLGIYYTMDATAVGQRLRIPGLQIEDASVMLGYDGTDLLAGGAVGFQIRNFGRGRLAATVDTAGRFGLEGGFQADTRLFDRAQMRLWYRSEGGFGGEGTLAITNPTKIRGIRAASVTARYAQGVFSATGTVEPQIPGLQSAGLSVRYGPDESGAHSLLIAGDLALAAGVPGVRGGNVHVEVLQRDEQWRVAASGEIQPAIPGVNATLRASYRDGAFIASVEAPFTVGERISGNLLVGVTNQQTDAEGRPVEGSTLADTLSGFGRGTATIHLSDQFQGSFGVRVASDASVRISGSVGIAQPITLFEARRWNRELVRLPTISIPIFGFAVGGNVVGIAATLGGGIDAEANVGPGQITEGRIGVEDFNPARPESLHVTGRVTFAVPATAGINGRLDAGISAGLAVVRATGGASIVLGLGVDAGARAQLDLDWTPAAGLVLAATLSASATPRLRASINGFAEVVADAFVTSFTLWRKDWRLAQREFGSGLTVGVSVPVTWRQTTGLDFDFNRVQFQVPEISAESALAGLLRDEGSTQTQNETNR